MGRLETVSNDILNYSTGEGQRLWNQATKSLSEDDPFDCNPDDMIDFLALVRNRAQINGWQNSILAIPKDLDDPFGLADNFLDHYGEISMEVLQAHAETYVTQPIRAAQDSVQLYECLLHSLSIEGRNKVTLHRGEYIRHDIGVGTLLLKVIIRESHVDTQATLSHLRVRLMATSLIPYMASINSDITKFNMHVMALKDQLARRGGQMTDLLENLFTTYESVKDAHMRSTPCGDSYVSDA